MFPLDKDLADFGQKTPSVVALRDRVAVHQSDSQCHPGVGQYQVIAGSLGNSQCILDLAHRRIIGAQHTVRDPQKVDVGQGCSERQGVGREGHREAVALVVSPSGTTHEPPGHAPRRHCDGQRRPEKDVAFGGVIVGKVDDGLRPPQHVRPLGALDLGVDHRNGQSHRQVRIADRLDQRHGVRGHPRRVPDTRVIRVIHDQSGRGDRQ